MNKEFELSVTEQETRVSPRSKRKGKRGEAGAPWYYLGLIGEIGFAIALPIAGGALVGVLIDRTWGTTPKATLSVLFLGVMVSFWNLFTTVRAIVREKR